MICRKQESRAASWYGEFTIIEWKWNWLFRRSALCYTQVAQARRWAFATQCSATYHWINANHWILGPGQSSKLSLFLWFNGILLFLYLQAMHFVLQNFLFTVSQYPSSGVWSLTKSCTKMCWRVAHNFVGANKQFCVFHPTLTGFHGAWGSRSLGAKFHCSFWPWYATHIEFECYTLICIHCWCGGWC